MIQLHEGMSDPTKAHDHVRAVLETALPWPAKLNALFALGFESGCAEHIDPAIEQVALSVVSDAQSALEDDEHYPLGWLSLLAQLHEFVPHNSVREKARMAFENACHGLGLLASKPQFPGLAAAFPVAFGLADVVASDAGMPAHTALVSRLYFQTAEAPPAASHVHRGDECHNARP